MKTHSKQLAIMSAILTGFINISTVQADDTAQAATLNYTNRAYVHAIHNAPNPVSDKKIEFAKIVYANQAFGPAIYSYLSIVAFQETDFNMAYVDTAYGQAIYSYPNNNRAQHRLVLSAETQHPTSKFIVPVALTYSYPPSATVNP